MTRIELDPIACDGHGLCAELLPELIALDDWGYPILADGGELPASLERLARRAAGTCPTLALALRVSGASGQRSVEGRPRR
jgi:ferredoxin